ncbi:MAG: RidA family protein [Firmicutes bacterium]|nr:RidA family protein [Bacillota bacterium]
MVEERVRQLGLVIPKVAPPVAAYQPGVLAGDLLFVSGQLPTVDGELKYRGRLGAELTVEEGYQAARACALNCLAVVKSFTGSLDRVVRIVKLNGYVSSAPDFFQQPQVVNGASELLGEVFGEAGRHARAAIGVSSLPLGAAVEVDLVVQVLL